MAGKPVFWAALVLLVLPFLFFWPLWWPAANLRQVVAHGDFVEQYYPMRVFVVGEWRQLHLPLWDPYTYAGTPAAAASLFAAFYPFNLWLALFPSPFPFVALELEAVLHLSLAGVFTMLLVRQWTGRTSAGLIAGAAFSLGGFLTSYPVPQLGILETAAWLPLGLWLLDRGLDRRSLRWIAVSGLVFAIAFLAGHPQTFLYIVYVTLAYFGYRAWSLRGSRRFILAAAVVLGVVTAGVGAVQWLPSLELARLSPRAGLSYAEVSGGFAVPELLGALRPNPGEWSPLYVGRVPLALAVLALAGAGLVSSFRVKRSPWFWLGIAVVALLLSLGRNGFLYPLAHAILPGFAVFRNQERAAYLVSFALAILAGLGWSGVVGLRKWPRAAIVAGTALVLVATAADLYQANFGLVLSPEPPSGYFPETGIVRHLQNTGGPDWRTSSEGLLPGDGNAGQVFRIRDVSGNSPLHLEAYDRFLAGMPEMRFWQLLNVQHLVTLRRLDHGALAPVGTDGDRRLYQVFVGAQPAWLVHDYVFASGPEAALQAAADPAVDPMTAAVLEGQPDPAPAPAIGPEEVHLVRFRPQAVTVDVALSAPGLLVSSEVAYPGWVARVDGRRVPTLRAYGLLRAVALPAGRLRVEWRYEPLPARLGLLISVVTLLLAGWGVLGPRFGRRLHR